MNEELMYRRMVEYFEAIKKGEIIKNLFSVDATIWSHKLGRMSVAKYDLHLSENPADVEQIRICNWNTSGCLITASIQIDLRPDIKLQYIDVFEFGATALIHQLYLCRVSPYSFNGNICIAKI